MGLFNKGEHSMKGDWGSFVVRRFHSGCKNLIEMPKCQRWRKKSFNIATYQVDPLVYNEPGQSFTPVHWG
jgi:hypothetical protein